MLLFCAFGYAQNTLEIKIFSEQEKEPLLGATIYIESLNKGATTNFNGIAFFEDLPNGEYNLQISYLGFETIEKSITVPSNEALIFFLKEDENALDEVIKKYKNSKKDTY